MAKVNNPAAKAIKRKVSSGNSEPKAYNHYNLYFILEREVFLQSKGVYPDLSSYQRSDSSAIDCTGLDLPPFPPKYSSLILPSDWFVHKKKKRAHVKTHGLVSFREMATLVSTNWKTEKSEVVQFVKAVAALMKSHLKASKEAKSSPPLLCPPPAPVSPMDSSATPFPAHFASAMFEPLPVSSSSIPNEQDRIHRMMDFLADAVSQSPTYTPPSWSWEIDPLREVRCADMCFTVSKDHKLRRASTSSTITELDLPDAAILDMWTSEALA